MAAKMAPDHTGAIVSLSHPCISLVTGLLAAKKLARKL